MTSLTKNISKTVNIAVLPLLLLFLIIVVAFLIGGVSLLGDAMKRYVYGFIVGLPFIFVIKPVRNRIFKKKK